MREAVDNTEAPDVIIPTAKYVSLSYGTLTASHVGVSVFQFPLLSHSRVSVPFSTRSCSQVNVHAVPYPKSRRLQFIFPIDGATRASHCTASHLGTDEVHTPDDWQVSNGDPFNLKPFEQLNEH